MGMDIASAARAIKSGGRVRTRAYATPVDSHTGMNPNTDYAFEVSAANLRFGDGVSKSKLAATTALRCLQLKI